jgi:hypothetical protein
MTKRSRRGTRRRLTGIRLSLAAAASLALLAVAGVTTTLSSTASTGPAGAASSNDPNQVMAAVGDIACEPDISQNSGNPASLKCGGSLVGNFTAETATAQQAAGMHPNVVALLGDEQYEVGKYVDFQNSFDKTWGPLKALSKPAPGNHEYYNYTKNGDNEAAQNGTGYFSYFNGVTGGNPNGSGIAGQDSTTNQGWYSYNIGSWHIISLNIECNSTPFGKDCKTNDTGLLAQETTWLSNDLANDTAKCTLAYWHQPTFSATTAGSPSTAAAPGAGSAEGGAADAWWNLLYGAHADLILNGHEHVYARFVPMDATGNSDPTDGIRQITIGTGGESLDTLAHTTDGSFSNPNVVTAENDAYGVMKLRLGDGTYTWSFHPAAAGPNAPANWNGYQDSGTGSCHS